MASLMHYARFGLALAAIFAFLATLNNVFGDNVELIPVAKYAACPGGLCAMTQLDKTPLAQTFRFVTPNDETIVVTCTRAAVLVGEYSCVREQRP